MTNTKLPTHYSERNNLISFWKDDHWKEDQENYKLQAIEKVLIQIDIDDDKGAKNVKS